MNEIQRRQIISISSGRYLYGSYEYTVIYQGSYTDEELINIADGSSYNYGGRIEMRYTNDDGITTAKVVVYID